MNPSRDRTGVPKGDSRRGEPSRTAGPVYPVLESRGHHLVPGSPGRSRMPARPRFSLAIEVFPIEVATTVHNPSGHPTMSFDPHSRRFDLRPGCSRRSRRTGRRRPERRTRSPFSSDEELTYDPARKDHRRGTRADRVGTMLCVSPLRGDRGERWDPYWGEGPPARSRIEPGGAADPTGPSRWAADAGFRHATIGPHALRRTIRTDPLASRQSRLWYTAQVISSHSGGRASRRAGML